MIFPDKKKTVSIILSRLNPSEGGATRGVEVKPEHSMNPSDEALNAISGDILSAFDERSPEKLTQALQAFIMSMDQGDEPAGEDGTEGDQHLDSLMHR